MTEPSVVGAGERAAPQADARLVLAYDAAKDILAIQDASLANVRTRANSVLTSAALLTSFSTGVGLLNLDPVKGPVLPREGAWLLLLCLLLIGGAVLNVLWPARGWHFGPGAAGIYREVQEGKSEDQIRSSIVDSMLQGVTKNHKMLEKRQNAFRASVVLLLLEVAVLVVMFVVNS